MVGSPGLKVAGAPSSSPGVQFPAGAQTSLPVWKPDCTVGGRGGLGEDAGPAPPPPSGSPALRGRPSSPQALTPCRAPSRPSNRVWAMSGLAFPLGLWRWLHRWSRFPRAEGRPLATWGNPGPALSRGPGRCTRLQGRGPGQLCPRGRSLAVLQRLPSGGARGGPSPCLLGPPASWKGASRSSLPLQIHCLQGPRRETRGSLAGGGSPLPQSLSVR